MGIFREGTNRLWAAFAAIYLLSAIAADFYWLFTDSGLIRWLAMLQAKVLGHWFPKLTFLILLLAELAPLLLLKLLIERITGVRLTAPPETASSNTRPA